MSLIDKLRRSRETKVEADGKHYTIRRPTAYEAARATRTSEDDFALVAQFVVGWELCELDIIPGGGPEPVPFNSALWAEWVADRPQVWGVLAQAIVDEYRKHAAVRDEAEKN